jgi:hypothetical protein
MSNYTKVDITTLNEIPIMKKSASLVTPHPQGSYRVEGNKTADKLVIVNAEQFWSKSKVLVIVVK